VTNKTKANSWQAGCTYQPKKWKPVCRGNAMHVHVHLTQWVKVKFPVVSWLCQLPSWSS